MNYKDEMIAKWEEYEKLQKEGKDRAVIKEDMLCLTDEATTKGE